ncbi:MAG TPA: zinc-binding alcohol dehydrogenase family protein [Acidobacteriaceae bacterium]|jgi:NADPH2:quinone reductase|nr:zinc-binding alcohol dehydrogenase family protein [Acidobacteriaceae bacterium]
MNAALTESFQSPPRYTQFDDPVPQQGEQPVRVLAAGLHRIVKALASGSHYSSTGALPFIPGIDGIGRLDDGRRIYFGGVRAPFGTFAERALASPHFIIPLPDSIPDATAAALANPAMSSWVALSSRAHFTAGESVLILGATGTSGQLAVQIARRRGARRVIAAGRNPAALEKTKSLGADATISLDQPHDDLVAAFRNEITGAGVDIVLDYVWGPPAETLLQAIAQKGPQKGAQKGGKPASPRIRFIQIGATAGADIKLPAATLRSTNIELLGSGFGSASLPEILAGIKDFFEEAGRNPFDIAVRPVPLRDVESAWNQPETGERIVFIP